MQTAPGASHSLVKLNENAKDPLNKHDCELSAGPRNSCKRHHKIIILRKCKDASCRRSCPSTCKTKANKCKCKGPNEPTWTKSKYANCRQSCPFTCKNQCRCKAAMSQRTGTITTNPQLPCNTQHQYKMVAH